RTIHAFPTRRSSDLVRHEDDVRGLAIAIGVVDLEGDDGVRTSTLRALPGSEGRAKHRQAFALLGEDEAEIFGLVEPEHFAAHTRSEEHTSELQSLAY